mmetsp:Transcript_61368/g.134944  ORF Transcript_61368/g.134944 Transcript_61368/m.134944 type:complete len:212 (+) Transcript_61368:1018-1653(+)
MGLHKRPLPCGLLFLDLCGSLGDALVGNSLQCRCLLLGLHSGLGMPARQEPAPLAFRLQGLLQLRQARRSLRTALPGLLLLLVVSSPPELLADAAIGLHPPKPFGEGFPLARCLLHALTRSGLFGLEEGFPALQRGGQMSGLMQALQSLQVADPGRQHEMCLVCRPRADARSRFQGELVHTPCGGLGTDNFFHQRLRRLGAERCRLRSRKT